MANSDQATRQESSTDRAQTSDGHPPRPGAARDLTELARDLDAEGSPPAVMRRIVRAVVDQVDGATGSAITLLEHGRLSSPAHSDDRARAVGEAQARTRQGPCVDTSRQEVTLRADDLRSDRRWPRWAEAAVQHGIHSALSFQLFVAGSSMGALDVYGDQPRAFDEEAEDFGLLLAAHAAIALASSRKIENLRIALASRDEIGQAKGILMERYRIDAGQAFDLLVRASQRSHRKLRDIAVRLAETGELVLDPPSTG
ncbi:MAG: GAF and ANTAR domain-containing protein [Jatrophihabitans sp.]|uniref:GAF and ANTAR domain-containing protein n=1 Tax=Jatrophihabitans sp. TaxID=1932789 RepID=UPI003F7F9285